MSIRDSLGRIGMDNLIEQPTDESFMNEALRLAKKAFDQEEVPVGAVVVRAGRIIARAWNQVRNVLDRER